MKSQDNHLNGFDWLRAIMSVFVVAWHMQLFGISSIFSKQDYLNHTFNITDLVNFHILLLAVPVFIFMSLFLFSIKIQSLSSLSKKLKKLFILAVFWISAIKIWNSGNLGLLKLIPSSTEDLLYLILKGGGTIYYFFTSLILCLILTYLISSLSKRNQITGLVISVLLIVLLPQISIFTETFVLSAFWSPLNFLPFCYGSVLLAQNVEYIVSRYYTLIVSILLYVGFSYVEWIWDVDAIFFPGQGYAIPAYTRISLFFGTITLIILALKIKKSSPLIIRFMSKYSLALFILHPFVISISKQIADHLFFWHSFSQIISAFIITLILSYTSAFILKTFVFKKSMLF